MTAFTPAYLDLLANGELAARADAADEHMKSCDLCAWTCRANRLAGKTGTCKTGPLARVSSFFPHMGEEDPLRGWCGSGTIFFAFCNLRCVYCQNFEISHEAEGQDVTPEQIAAMMLALQAQGCHNVNFVSPSHVVAPILRAVLIAAENGLRLPLVWNTGGYDSLAALKLLDGVVDIYMPDMKYGDAKVGRTYSNVPDYPKHNQRALKEMHRQVGDLVLDADGIALRGLLVRHLVLPGGLAGTREVMRFLARLSRDTYVNVMPQYRPAFKAAREDMGDLSRPVTRAEVEAAVQLARAAGLHRFDERRGGAFF
ncbi:MAG: radical SAM protein [Anaerolineae bacterium]|nr:radical SAM protein [Anaerolineae bacterium]